MCQWSDLIIKNFDITGIMRKSNFKIWRDGPIVQKTCRLQNNNNYNNNNYTSNYNKKRPVLVRVLEGYKKNNSIKNIRKCLYKKANDQMTKEKVDNC